MKGRDLSIDVAIVGAGPYGLSLASHLRARGVGFRIFGQPMQSWRAHMPVGMQLTGRAFDEATLLLTADAYERETAWWKQRPPLGAS